MPARFGSALAVLLFVPFTLLLSGFVLMTSAEEPKKAPVPPFQSLYNGKDLEGWEVYQGELGAWQAAGELLSCVKEGGGWLRTKKVYSDFVLKLEYRIPAGGNSGVGIRVPPEGNVHQAGMEIQILDDDAPAHKDLKAAQYTGSLYYQAAAKRGAPKAPGEWNQFEILCAGRQVRITLNGKVITDVNLDEYFKAEDPNNYSALAERPEVGFIALQSHGSRVDFRNVEVQDLTTTTESGLQYFDAKVGNGEVVEKDDIVRVHYTGRLIDGTKFDSSRDRGQAAQFPLNAVIPGWTEGVTGMKIGGRRKLVIPYKLAYGEAGRPPQIPPKATLVFDVEVVGVL